MRRWRLFRLGVSLGVAILALVTGPATAGAALPDANCPGPADSNFLLTGGFREAQTFTVINTGTLIQAQTQINKTNAGGNFQLQILATDGSGTPINGILGAATLPDASVPAGITTLVGNFNPGVAVQAGQRLALVVTRPGGANYRLLLSTVFPCPGDIFFSNNQTDPFAPDNPDTDFVFQTTVDPTNSFTIGKVKGTKLTLTVPGKGAIAVADAISAHSAGATAAKAKKLLKAVQATASGPGAVTVKLRLTKAAKQLLNQNGKLTAKAAVTFTPTGGSPNTQRRKLKFKS